MIPRCQTCKGAIMQHSVGGRPSGPWFHVHADDWQDRPHNVPCCVRCGVPLTADDPAVTTLGPRCRKHW